MKKKYSLKSHDITLIDFCCTRSGNRGILEIIDVNKKAQHLLPFSIRENLTVDNLEEWLFSRISVGGKKLLRKIQSSNIFLDYQWNPLRYVEVTRVLSLIDTFWIQAEYERLTWNEINLYSNSFSPILGEIVLGTESIRQFDFAPRSPQYTSEGVLRKAWIKNDGDIYLVKADNVRGITSQAVMEWFAFQVARYFGIPHIEYNLDSRKTTKGEILDVCICKAFTDINISFVNAGEFFRYKGFSKFRAEDLENPDLQRELANCFDPDFYAKMMVFDYLIGNTDRHLGNFGFLYDSRTGELLRPAPLFDSGKSFFADDPRNPCRDVEEWLDSAQITSFMKPEDQLATFLSPDHAEGLERVASMTLQPHPAIPLPEVDLLQTFVRTQARRALQQISTHSPCPA